jgi:hypothetical protein
MNNSPKLSLTSSQSPSADNTPVGTGKRASNSFQDVGEAECIEGEKGSAGP